MAIVDVKYAKYRKKVELFFDGWGIICSMERI